MGATCEYRESKEAEQKWESTKIRVVGCLAELDRAFHEIVEEAEAECSREKDQ